VILTISSTGPNAGDLSFLFHKHPERVQEFALSFGRALVFYPRYDANSCEIAVILDLDPLRLAGRGQRAGLPLYPYVNDRPFVASSFLSVALAEVFKSALNGQCKTRPQLVDHAFPFEVKLPCLPVRGSTLLPSDLFGPLGYRVHITESPLDTVFPEWGQSPYVSCSLAATVALKDLLNHLYVLMPVLDDQKHYWIDEQGVEKLLRRGETWLAQHPERNLIVARYLKRRRPLVAAAESRLVAEEGESEEPNADDAALAPAKVVYGHIVNPHPEWVNNTINIDTGCVFGGRLTALRYPELELVSVPARRAYVEGRVTFVQEHALTTQQQVEDVLDLADFTGKRIIETDLLDNVTIREENSAAALEVMSRFAVAPQWLIYLPPTMSPCATATAEGYLEHPAEAFAYFAEHGVEQVLCEQKHMGSRAVVIAGRSPPVIRHRFGFLPEHEVGLGMVYTRTGRRFFEDRAIEHEILEHLTEVLSATGFWEAFETDWVCLDAELMPWSFKAGELLMRQYGVPGCLSPLLLVGYGLAGPAACAVPNSGHRGPYLFWPAASMAPGAGGGMGVARPARGNHPH
jgi:hypothetical protein